MKTSTIFRKVFGCMLLIAVLQTGVQSAQASNAWHYFYDEFHVYPSGAGKIYVSDNYAEDEESITGWTTDYETQFCEYGINGHDFYIYTQPADGWIPYGVAIGTRADELSEWSPTTDENGNVVINNQQSPFRYSPTSNIEEQDSMSAVAKAPLFPDGCAYLVFTHVAARVAKGQSSFGKSSASKTVNDIGDDIELTATPADERCHFTYWERKSDGKQFTENPLPVSVTGAEEYYAHFSCDSAVVLKADSEEGSWFVWYDEDTHLLVGSGEGDNNPGNATIYVFTSDSLYIGNDSYLSPYKANVFYPAQPHVAFVTGEVYAVRSPLVNALYSLTNPLAQWSGDNGVAAADFANGMSYYVIDPEDRCFTLHDRTTDIAPKTIYVAVSTELFPNETAAQILYWDNESARATGISQTEILRAQQNGKIYTIGGMRVTSLGRDGIYIIDGKKKVLRKNY